MSTKVNLMLIGLVVLGAALRLGEWGQWAANPDEGINWSIATSIDLEFFFRGIKAHTHPPLYYLLLYLISSFSVDLDVFRCVALVSGVSLIPMSFIWLRVRLDTLSAMAVAGIVTLSPELIMQSTLVRPYTFLLLLIVLALWLQDRYHRTEKISNLFLAALFWTAALLTHYAAGFALVGGGLIIFFSREIPKKIKKNLIFVQIMSGLIGVISAIALMDPGTFKNASGFHSASLWLDPFYINDTVSLFKLLEYQFNHMFGIGPFKGFHQLMIPFGFFILWRKNRTLVIAGVAGLLISIIISAVHLYPLGSGRHSLWIFPFLAPCLLAVPGRLLMGSGGFRFCGAVLIFFIVKSCFLPNQKVREEYVLERTALRDFVDWMNVDNANRIYITDFQTLRMLRVEWKDNQNLIKESEDLYKWPDRPVYALWEWHLKWTKDNVKRIEHLRKTDKEIWMIGGGWGRQGDNLNVGSNEMGAMKIVEFIER